MAYDSTPYLPRHIEQDARAGPEVARRSAKWALGFALFFAMLALLVSLQLFQLTSEGPAKRTLRRATAVLTEIDALIDRQYDDLQTRAEAVGPDETVRLNDYPIAAGLTRDEALGASKEEMRRLVLDRSANALYAQGTGALRSDAGDAGDLGVFSLAGVTDNGLGFLRNRNHDILGFLTVGLAVICALLAGAVAACGRGFGRLVAVGIAVLAAALPVLLGGLTVLLYAHIGAEGGSEYLQREFFAIGEELAWLPIRTGLAFTALGLVVLVTGATLAVLSDRRAAR